MEGGKKSKKNLDADSGVDRRVFFHVSIQSLRRQFSPSSNKPRIVYEDLQKESYFAMYAGIRFAKCSILF